MDARVQLLADDVWASEDDKTSFLIDEVYFFIDHIWKNDQSPFPWC